MRTFICLFLLAIPLAAAPSKSVEAIAAEVKPSVVKVMQVGRDGVDGLGAGFVVSADGLIATNMHVIGEARRLEVEMANGDKHEVVEVTATDAHWDLAILRVAKKGLKPLTLADSDSIRQGQPIVAMGNPGGLAFSVVDGVVSEFPDVINDIPMIRLAIPIEKGNSGGPLLDRQGHVLGILTMKSAVTDNLGFAMPVNELKHLIEKPNPVPMQRWLTIGVLNPKVWTPLLGGRWTQHAGIIKAATAGTGFGGRSLCLRPADKPEGIFEVAVNVRLEDESGAAGLVFCSDGEDAHYGFYPSAGKLRLTRFEGPDVYSWTILADVATEAYRPGDWNHLRVRVEPEQITCWVNGQRVLVQTDDGLRGGSVGLCKFRNTVAEFRGFRVGSDLAEKPVPAALAATIDIALETFTKSPAAKKETLKQLLDKPSASRRLLVEKRRQLEQQATALRDLEKDLHRHAITLELAAELAKPEDQIDLIRATLLLARHDNPEVEITQYLQNFARMVDDLKKDPEIAKGTLPAVKRLNRYLFEEGGFHGSRHDYSNKSNSYMNELLDDREGLPITLSVLYIELASRLGVKGVHGIPLPGKFMVGYREGPEGELKLVDVFERGKTLSVEEAALELTERGEFAEESLEPSTKRAIVLRMLNNLLSSTLDDATAIKETMPYLDLSIALDPDAAIQRINRARMKERLGLKQEAAEDVRWLTENFPEDGPGEIKSQLQDWLDTLE
ncbi:S1-C subfamily serine protease [Prosthecobacter fusiformis]|uniref:S1-C subfamily serine protease n=1 Tax=Prosthecobacter fusiformis TaxID=48464 RepID=A0A4R7SPR9_9BACT|nr:transglutaminase family protein [Prosthecobacter fusiformis]TDU81212.1 S1-C subfamily serine protease [Prosthecobacter fusiformis]